jgi:FSR family fosmidomycin resistance protein-like MFS transporter
MDAEPKRHEQNMARWTFSGSFGVTLGPVLLVGLTALGFGWRGVFLALALLAGLVVLFVWNRITDPGLILPAFPRWNDIVNGFRSALLSLKNRDVFRWLTLLQFSDLMLDVLLGFLALYFHDVAGLEKAQAASAVLVWLVAGLVGDFLLIPLLEKVDGIRYLRFSVLLELILFPAFLLIPSVLWKLVTAGLLGFFNSGWYAILQGRLYTSMRSRSASVMTLSNLAGLVGGLLPLAIGVLADDFGLNAAMWVLLAGPIALLLGIPWKNNTPPGRNYDFE